MKGGEKMNSQETEHYENLYRKIHCDFMMPWAISEMNSSSKNKISKLLREKRYYEQKLKEINKRIELTKNLEENF